MRRLTRELVDSERSGIHAAVEPKDAATLIIVDRSARPPKVLLGRRHARHVFMPGKFVFPGGRVDTGDRAVGAGATLHPAVERKLLSQTGLTTAAEVAAFPLAAIRETFEETGLVIGHRGALPVQPDGSWKKFARTGFVPEPSALHFIARAITPPGFPHRYDARFFLVEREMVTCQIEGAVHRDAELVELVWLPITEAQRLDMPHITGLLLDELEERVAAGFTPELPVPFYDTRDGEFGPEMID